MKLKKFLTVLAFSLVLLAPNITWAQSADCSGFYAKFNIDTKSLTQNPTNEKAGNALQGVPQYCSAAEVLNKALLIMFSLAAGVAVLFIMIGGFQYIMAAGNQETVEKARKILVNSIIGLVVIVLAATLVRIVVNTLAGNFKATSSSSTFPAAGGSVTNNSSSGNVPAGSNPSGSSATGGPASAGSCSDDPTAMQNAQRIACLTPLVSVTGMPTVITDQTQNVQIKFNSSDKDTVSKLCKVATADQVAATLLVVGGSQIGGGNVSPSGGVYSIFIPLSSKNVSGTTKGKLAATVCGLIINTQDFEVASGSFKSSGSTPTDDQITQAANNSRFEAKWQGDTLSVDLSQTLQSQDVATMCAKPLSGYDNSIAVELDGKTVDKQSSTIRQFTVHVTGLPAGTNPNVSVAVCGYEIAGAQPSR